MKPPKSTNRVIVKFPTVVGKPNNTELVEEYGPRDISLGQLEYLGKIPRVYSSQDSGPKR